ncbi:MAG: hypothetical protein FJX80_01030 [Bacteroidetes bacterium]|nr:hypothetical protein [Bacteroidota bacterium]
MMLPFNNAFRKSYEDAQLKFIEPVLKTAYTNPKELDIAVLNIMSPISFLLASELKKSKPDGDLILRCIEKLKQDPISFGVIDDDLLLTPIDTRGDQINFLKSNENERALLLENIKKLKVTLPINWTDFISIINTITFVSVTGKEGLLEHFSGSDSDRWGAMHMSNNIDLLNIAECLTHEASHHWMNLYEFYTSGEFIEDGWSNNSFVSPWRRDKRPLMGIYHGIYVFANVFIVLQYLNNLYQKDCDRLHYVGAQVKRGIEIIELNKKYLSPNALKLLSDIIQIFERAYIKTPQEVRHNFYQKIMKEEITKQH